MVVLLPASTIFIVAVFGKPGAGYTGTQAYRVSARIPGELLPVVIAQGIGGGLLAFTVFGAGRLCLDGETRTQHT